MYQNKKRTLLIFMGVILLLEFVAYLISIKFVAQLLIISAAVAVAMRFFFIDIKEQETKKKLDNYMKRLR